MGRGPHAADAGLFAEPRHPALREAVAQLSWLLGHGYADTSALKLVGDRHRLRGRQRDAVRRCACSDAARESRAARRVELAALADQAVAVDGFNCIIITESALAGGVVLRGRDGAVRDLASVHGNYRRVETTTRALGLLTSALRPCADVTWVLDRPVSNSGRLRAAILEMAPPGWNVELPFDADRELVDTDRIVASADATVLDACGPWVDLPGAVIAASVPDAFLIDLG